MSERPVEPLYRLPTYQHADAQGIWLCALAAVLLDVAVSLELAASVLAARWHHLAVLGSPWWAAPTYPDMRLLAATACGVAGIAAMGAAAWRARPGAGAGAGWPEEAGGLGRVGLALLVALPFAAPALLLAGTAALLPLYRPLAWVRWSARYQNVAVLAGDLTLSREVLFGTLGVLLALTLGATPLEPATSPPKPEPAAPAPIAAAATPASSTTRTPIRPRPPHRRPANRRPRPCSIAA